MESYMESPLFNIKYNIKNPRKTSLSKTSPQSTAFLGAVYR
jgi:hypothetical protein